MTVAVGAGAGIDLLALHRLHPERYPFLLESVAPSATTGRYDLLFAFPGQAIDYRLSSGADSAAQLTTDSTTDASAFLQALRFTDTTPAIEWLNPDVDPDGDPEIGPLPFYGGWFVYLGYEFSAALEGKLRLPASPHQLPDAFAVRCPAAVIVDRHRNRSYLVAEQVQTQIQSVNPLIAQMQVDLAAVRAVTETLCAAVTLPAFTLREEVPARFLSGVSRILEYLLAGDCFQANLSRRWDVAFAHAPDPTHVYSRLRDANPAPFAGLARWQGSAVISSSPERLVEMRGERLETRPIAGTAPRSVDPHADAATRAALIASIKDRAEHVMLLDLERNDLGRVCAPGSVRVAELIEVESYALVHHLVSSVCGSRRADIDAADVVRALFPGGTITGCPKIRAMEIIAELEGEGRGPYTGSMGYLSIDGQMDLNILIRTMVLEGQTASFRAGAGIVADSQPDAELAETRQKARGLLRALDSSL